MSAIKYTNIIPQLFDEINKLLNNYVYHSYNAMAHFIKYPLGLAVILYICLLGVSLSQGWIKLSMSEFVKSSLKIAFIYMAALNWNWFSQMGVAVIQAGAEEIASVLIHASPESLPHSGGAGIQDALQSVLTEYARIVNWTWDQGSWRNFSPWIAAFFIGVFGFAMIMISILEIILAKMMLAILFCTAPLFVGFTLFKPTQGFFDRWLGSCVGFGLVIIFVSAVLVLSLAIEHWSIADLYANHAAHIQLMAFVPAVVVGFLCMGIVLTAAELALSIGNIVSTSSNTALLAGMVGGFVGGATSSTMSVQKLFQQGVSTGEDIAKRSLDWLRKQNQRLRK